MLSQTNKNSSVSENPTEQEQSRRTFLSACLSMAAFGASAQYRQSGESGSASAAEGNAAQRRAKSGDRQNAERNSLSLDVSERGLSLIKSFEGLHLRAYRCPAGVATIGYGHTQGVQLGDTLSGEGQAAAFLRQDLARHVREVNAVFQGVPLTQDQFDALASASFNCGCLKGGTSGFAKYAQREFKRLADSSDPGEQAEISAGIVAYLCRYNRANGKMLDGLLRRRLSEGLMLVGDANPIVSIDEYRQVKKEAEAAIQPPQGFPKKLAEKMARFLLARRGIL